MRPPRRSRVPSPGWLTIAVAALGCTVLVVGCGSAVAPSVGPSVQRRFSLWSPALIGRKIPARYTCSSEPWLPVRWDSLPPDTGQLVLTFGSFGSPRKVGNTLTSSVVAGAGFTGLRPAAGGLARGPLPRGAGRLVDRSMPDCPHEAAGVQLIFRAFALASGDRLTPASSSSASAAAVLEDAQRTALATGEFVVEYG